MVETKTTWLVPFELAAFEGHFEGNPIVPGVVLLDQAFIRAQALSGHTDCDWHVTQAKFLSPVRPGEQLTFNLNLSARSAIYFEICSGERAVATGVFTSQIP
jgi:3-hydroxymyristoyl/3-hydroxydecanoyl-(acyl carrier protein) dehydratase